MLCVIDEQCLWLNIPNQCYSASSVSCLMRQGGFFFFKVYPLQVKLWTCTVLSIISNCYIGMLMEWIHMLFDSGCGPQPFASLWASLRLMFLLLLKPLLTATQSVWNELWAAPMGQEWGSMNIRTPSYCSCCVFQPLVGVFWHHMPPQAFVWPAASHKNPEILGFNATLNVSVVWLWRAVEKPDWHFEKSV